MAQWAAMFAGAAETTKGGSNPIAMILLAVLAPIAALLVQMAVSRSREFRPTPPARRSPGGPGV
jgi:heat shock protein HtpX